MVHADLEDAELRRLRHARQRQRHAPMVVVGFLRGVRGAGVRQAQPQHLLGAGLARAAGDGDDAGIAAHARRPADALPAPRANLPRGSARRRPCRGDSPWTTSAAAAPALKASPTKSWPSRSAFSATNTSPGASVRVSIEKPVMGASGVPSPRPSAAATSSSHCQSGSVIGFLSPSAHRGRRRGRRTG